MYFYVQISLDMVKSMTGYGKAEALLEGGRITVEIRTLNGNLNVTLVLYRYDDQIYNTKNTAPATKNEYTEVSVSDLANYNVVSVRCTVGNIVQILNFYRAMGDVPQYIIDYKNSVYIRGGFLVDWTNNLVKVRWVDGDATTTPPNVYFDRVVGVG